MIIFDLDAIDTPEMTDDERRKAMRRAIDTMVKRHIAHTRMLHREMVKYIEARQ